MYTKKTIKMYVKANGRCPVADWLESLIPAVRYRIKARLTRVVLGNLGDVKYLGDNVSEMRFMFGSGYRLYFSQQGNDVILLLCGGDKGEQNKDIKLAKQHLSDYIGGL